ncbi:MAG: DUF4149 domain-containing protein [Candidatus Binatia bacterium]|nr:DUF4149 domain-containing protein [Candidatus Binatia bacterium]
MLRILSGLYLLALAIWVGTLIFHSFVVAPAVFRTLPQATAGEVVSRIFPTYYAIGYVCGALTFILPWLVGGKEAGWRWASMIAGGMLACTLLAGTVIHPRASALRGKLISAPAESPERAQFRQLHRSAVILNLLVLSGGLVLVGIVSRQLRW